MIEAGRLTERVRFERSVPGTDADGSPTDGRVTLLECWASFRPQFGSEKLAAGQFESTSRGQLAVRRSTAAMGITPDDRVVFLAGGYAGLTANIESVVRTPDRAGLEFLVTIGVAT